MPDKKLTDSEVVKDWLNTVVKELKTKEFGMLRKENAENLCDGLTHALDLINRLQIDKQNLEIELQAMRGAANSYKLEVERLKKELDEARTEVKNIIKELE